ncbi:MAG: FMN-binding negative transcriptional regulator [Gammaproteobacteria bacterium]|nr:FMN-binding negative transcriptional regulator [Gammaproteobacteria bacterium]MDH3536665.1 FMN-binding negative transcriptional regulator [Gammaproteobacteria bacterium]
MYLPDHFKISEAEEIFSFLDANAFGQLVSMQDDRFMVSHLPFLISADRKQLHCHLARQNPQWQQLEGQQVLVTFQGPHDYVSPSWYQSPGVPTWNYQAVHVYGGCRVFDAAGELATLVEALSARYESAFENPWEPQYRDAMLKAIVGVEIAIDEIQCKYKLSQNRSEADQQGVIDRLDELGSESLVRAMRKTLL